jgi:hypothetical protein
MLSLKKRVMEMYMPLLAKMDVDNPLIMFIKMNFELLCDVNLFIFFIVITHVRNCPCIDQVFKEKCFCMQLCCYHKDMPRSTLLSLCGFGNKICF